MKRLQKKQWVVAAFTHKNPNLKAHFFLNVFKGIRKAFKNKNVYLKINPQETPVDGILLIAPEKDETYLLQSIRKTGIPTVVLCGRSDVCPSVDTDNRYAAFEMVSNLLKKHSTVAMITGKMDTINGRDRFLGYQDALKKHGRPLRKALVISGRFDQSKGKIAMKKLLESKKHFSAVFAANDQMAFGALDVLRQKKIRVPQEMAVAGFDGMPAAKKIEPSLSTMKQPFLQIGKVGANLLWKQIQGGKKLSSKIIYLRARFVQGNSI